MIFPKNYSLISIFSNRDCSIVSVEIVFVKILSMEDVRNKRRIRRKTGKDHDCAFEAQSGV
jgi:hypothetical protein